MNPVSLNSRAHTPPRSFPSPLSSLLTPSLHLPLSPPQGLIQTPERVPLAPQNPPSLSLQHPQSCAAAAISHTCKKSLLLRGRAAREHPPVLCFIRQR